MEMARKLIVSAALLAALTAGVAVAVAATRVPVVTTATNATIGHTVLVARNGHTLYSLSAEQHGRFICKDKTCLSFWKPLVVRKGSTPTGAARLGTIQRPDGRIQVTYKSLPLYTFTGDHARSDAKGEGFKDVGTWHAATVGSASATTTTTPTTTTDDHGGGGGGGYYG
jgi:predicted lipoprotein with Yx(FWY)xxD motif